MVAAMPQIVTMHKSIKVNKLLLFKDILFRDNMVIILATNATNEGIKDA